MSKRKPKKRKQQLGRPVVRRSSTPANVEREHDRRAQAERLARQGDWAGARDALLELDRRRPGQLDVLNALSRAYIALQDFNACESVCRRILKLRPNDPDSYLMLAGAQMTNIHPALARQTFRRFLERWPDDPQAEEVRKTVADIEAALEGSLMKVEFPVDDVFELAASNEEVLALLGQGQFAPARETAERLLRRYPRFVPALNNQSEAWFRDGQGEQAIATARRALEVKPENCHALGNLARYLCVGGRMDEARQVAQRLKTIDSDHADLPLKQAEALSMLGEDEGVCSVFERHLRTGHVLLPADDALLHHLAAVASARLGRDADAVRLWQESLKLRPGFALARENLADHRRPPGERHGPWPFDITHWIPHGTLRVLMRQIGPAAERATNRSVIQQTRKFLERHSEVVRILPLLFDRGGPDAAAFAIKLSAIAKTPETLEPLHVFAFGQRGADALRMEAVEVLLDSEFMPPGEVRLWIGGKWRDILLTSYELYREPARRLTPPAQRLLQEAHVLLARGEGSAAKPLLEEALAIEPNSPILHNNLMTALHLEGRNREAEQMIYDIHERFPDYFFGRINMANDCVAHGEYDRAKEFLGSLMRQRRMHVSEFSALCMSHVHLFLAQGKRDEARTWLEMWERGFPDDPQLPAWRENVEQSRWSIFGKPFR